MAITRPCAPGMGFSTCPSFLDGVAKPQPPTLRATESACPVHDLRGVYDRNDMRLVLGMQNGIRWGTGPSKGDMGVEFRCLVM